MRRSCGRARQEARATPSTTTSSTAETHLHRSPPSGTSLLCRAKRSSTATIPPRNPCASSGGPFWPPVGRGPGLRPVLRVGNDGCRRKGARAFLRWDRDGARVCGACGTQDRGRGARGSATRTPWHRRCLDRGSLAPSASRQTTKPRAVVALGVSRHGVSRDNASGASPAQPRK
jgi:hypothetical protein